MTRLLLSGRVVPLLLASLLLAACGGGATSSGIGNPGGNPNVSSNATLTGLTLACANEQPPCAGIRGIAPEGVPQQALPPEGFLPGTFIFQGETHRVTEYASVQSAQVDSVTITPTALVAAVSILVNGVSVPSGATSDPIPLTEAGETEIVIFVTAVNGIANLTYRITVTRLSRDNADLTTLSLSTGALQPAFQPATTAYTSTVQFATEGVRVTAATAEPLATVEVNGTPLAAGEQSALIALGIGENLPIEIRVTALSGAQKTYRITVTRLGTAALSGLALLGLTDDVPLQEIVLSPNPAFAADTLNYASRVENRVREITVTATAMAPGAVITINGIERASGEESAPIELQGVGEGEENENEITIVVTHDVSGGDEPFTRTYTVIVTRQAPPLFEPEAFLKPADPGTGFLFGAGSAISADGNTAAIGAPGAGGTGAVMVYIRVGDDWVHHETLPGPSETGAEFGRSVALSANGEFLAVGAPGVPITNGGEPVEGVGEAYLYMRDTVSWSLLDTLPQFNAGEGYRFGDSIALAVDGDTLTVAVSAPFESSGEGGIHPAPVAPENHDDNDAIGSGAVHLFSCQVSGEPPCVLQAFLKAPEPVSFLDNQGVNENFGASLSISATGDVLAVGMPGESTNASGIGGTATAGLGESGAVHLYTRTAGVWGEADRVFFKATLPRAGYRFGAALTLSADGETLAVGTPRHGGAGVGVGALEGPFPIANNSGSVHVYVRDTEAEAGWTQQIFIKPSNTRTGLAFGTTLALSADGSRLVVGAPGEDSSARTVDGNELLTNAPRSGAGYVYRRDGGVWSKIAYLKGPNSRAEIAFGSAIGMSGDGERVLVGAPREGTNTTGVDMTLPYDENNLSANRGAAYLFLAVDPPLEEGP